MNLRNQEYREPDTAQQGISRRSMRHAMARDPQFLINATLAITLTAGTAGLAYIACATHAARTARTAGTQSDARNIILFGKASRDGKPCRDFTHRIERADRHLNRGDTRTQRWFLLGGAEPGTQSEAQIAHEHLNRMGEHWHQARIVLENRSRNTRENIRNAIELGLQHGQGKTKQSVALLSNRYHLARCHMVARHAGIQHCDLLAAEDRFHWNLRSIGQIAREGALILLELIHQIRER